MYLKQCRYKLVISLFSLEALTFWYSRLMGDEYYQSSSPFIPSDSRAILETQKNVTLSAVNTQIEGLQSNLLKAQTADISAPPRSTQHEQKNPLGLFWQFRPSTSNYNDTLYYNLIHDLTIQHKTVQATELSDSLHNYYCQTEARKHIAKDVASVTGQIISTACAVSKVTRPFTRNCSVAIAVRSSWDQPWPSYRL